MEIFGELVEVGLPEIVPVDGEVDRGALRLAHFSSEFQRAGRIIVAALRIEVLDVAVGAPALLEHDGDGEAGAVEFAELLAGKAFGGGSVCCCDGCSSE